jgi:hypothetical protein
MIKLKDLIREAKDSKKEIPDRMDLAATAEAVCKYVENNKSKLKKYLDDADIKSFYKCGYDKFPNADQDDVAQEMNKAAISLGWLNDSENPKMPTEKELETAAFGEKKLQKGVKMGDYTKKNKAPKNTEEDLVQPYKNKK